MYKESLEAISWYFRLGRKFFSIVPLGTTVLVFTNLVAQLSLLVSFLLPLKIIVLLGTNNDPRYLPEPFASIDKHELVTTLSLLTILSYLVFLVAEKLSLICSATYTDKLLKNNNKIFLFENQNEIATKSYKQFTLSVASITFFTLSMTALGIFYFDVFLTILIFSITTTALIMSIYPNSHAVQSAFNTHLHKTINGLANFGFFTVFAFIVVDFMYFSPPIFLIALATIIFSRQLFVQAGIGIQSVFNLYQRKGKLDALFHREHVFIPDSAVKKSTIWSLIEPESIEKWLPGVLSGSVIQDIKSYNVVWLQSGIDNIIFLRITVSNSNDWYLVKIFDKAHTAKALHEAALLTESPKRLPSPALIYATTVFDMHCHVFDCKGMQLITPDAEFSFYKLRFLSELLSVTPPHELVDRFKRSKRMLWDRLEEKMFDRLCLVAEENELALIMVMKESLPDLKHRLQLLPLMLVTPLLNGPESIIKIEKSIMTAHWANWKLEPIGSGWPTTEQAQEKLKLSLTEACETRPELKSISYEMVKLAAVLSSFEKAFQQQRYLDAITLLKEVPETPETNGLE